MQKLIIFYLVLLAFLLSGCIMTNNIKIGKPQVLPKIKVLEQTYGGSKDDIANAITPTKDGGFIVAGWTNSFGNGKKDIYLLKIDKYGNKVWEKTYGGRGDDRAYDITPTKDGGFIVAGWTNSFGNGKKDIYLLKIDKYGNKVWEKTYGGRGDDRAYDITPTKDGGFIVAGFTYSFGNGRKDIYILKIDKNGNKLWERTYGGRNSDIANSIIPTKDGGFIVAGFTYSFGNGKYDVYLIKIDKNLNKIWQKTYGRNEYEKVYDITPTKDGGFIVVGETNSFGNGRYDVYLIKIEIN